MKFSIRREAILKPLQLVGSVVERRQTLPILANVLISAQGTRLSLTGTDLEVELVACTQADSAEAGEVTLPARKFLDICRALPEQAILEVSVDAERATIRSGRSRFSLATLPATEFPNIDAVQPLQELAVPQKALRQLLDKTHFAMAQQDVRYYLNGLLLEIGEGRARAVATDGHRLAMCDIEAEAAIGEVRQVIVPRKGVLELTRLLDDSESEAVIKVGSNHLRVELAEQVFTSKLIDGRFPDYQRVVPRGGDKIVIADREPARQALSRASILSNEKYRGVRVRLSEGLMEVQANNPELEEAEEQIEVDYRGAALEIGFNVNYVLDALAAIDGERVQLELSDSNSSCLIHAEGDGRCKYVVMPMRL